MFAFAARLVSLTYFRLVAPTAPPGGMYHLFACHRATISSLVSDHFPKYMKEQFDDKERKKKGRSRRNKYLKGFDTTEIQNSFRDPSVIKAKLPINLWEMWYLIHMPAIPFTLEFSFKRHYLLRLLLFFSSYLLFLLSHRLGWYVFMDLNWKDSGTNDFAGRLLARTGVIEWTFKPVSLETLARSKAGPRSQNPIPSIDATIAILERYRRM